MDKKSIFGFTSTNKIDFQTFKATRPIITKNLLRNLNLPRALFTLYQEPISKNEIYYYYYDNLAHYVFEIAFMELQKYRHDINLLDRNLLLLWTFVNYNKYLVCCTPNITPCHGISDNSFKINFQYPKIKILFNFDNKSEEINSKIEYCSENRKVINCQDIEVIPNLLVRKSSCDSNSKLYSAYYKVRNSKTIKEYNHYYKIVELNKTFIYEITNHFSYRQLICTLDDSLITWIKDEDLLTKYINKANHLHPIYEFNKNFISANEFKVKLSEIRK